MPEKARTGKHLRQRRALRPSVKIVIAALALLVLVLTGIRVYHWSAQRGDARVIVLVNPWNDVTKSGFKPSLKTVEGVQVDKSCAKELEKLLADCRASGTPITLTAGYRTQDEQLKLLSDESNRQMLAGYDADRAFAVAEQRVGKPGATEHELGLAVDVQGAAAQAWMRENGWRYGFILRYPAGSESITGRSADSSHFRYVGPAAAEQITSLGITLEEYMGMFYTQEAEIEISQ